jgi:hypothetical protein
MFVNCHFYLHLVRFLFGEYSIAVNKPNGEAEA